MYIYIYTIYILIGFMFKHNIIIIFIVKDFSGRNIFVVESNYSFDVRLSTKTFFFVSLFRPTEIYFFETVTSFSIKSKIENGNRGSRITL